MPASCGFDAGDYPGDAAVTAWSGAGSPFQFISFYLQAPCHGAKFITYAGRYGFLKAQGWGFAIVYVGRQQKGCGSKSLSQANGATDGADAIDKSKAEGFPGNSIVYLDVEPFDGAISPAMKDYAGAWIDAFLRDGTYRPGIYCHAKNALDLHQLGEERYAAAGRPAGAPSFWITRPKAGFDIGSSVPTDCGLTFADVWQGQIGVGGVSHGGVTIDPIDLNVANSPNPSQA